MIMMMIVMMIWLWWMDGDNVGRFCIPLTRGAECWGYQDDDDNIDDGDDDGGDTKNMVGNQAVAGLGLVCHKGYVQPMGERG